MSFSLPLPCCSTSIQILQALTRASLFKVRGGSLRKAWPQWQGQFWPGNVISVILGLGFCTSIIVDCQLQVVSQVIPFSCSQLYVPLRACPFLCYFCVKMSFLLQHKVDTDGNQVGLLFTQSYFVCLLNVSFMVTERLPCLLVGISIWSKYHHILYLLLYRHLFPLKSSLPVISQFFSFLKKFQVTNQLARILAIV